MLFSNTYRLFLSTSRYLTLFFFRIWYADSSNTVELTLMLSVGTEVMDLFLELVFSVCSC